jgi:hypothetical protein
VVAKVLGAVAGVLAVAVAFAAIFGWLTALCWNHFPFLETTHHMSVWDGVVLQFLSGLVFKSAGSANSSS